MIETTPLPVLPAESINGPYSDASVSETQRANLLANLFDTDTAFSGVLQPDPPANYSSLTPSQLANEVIQRLL